MSGFIVQGDAFALPFRDGTFDVVVADPPYDVPSPNRGNRRRTESYVLYRSRAWWSEAWRVLKPEGHLYVYCVISEIRGWLNDAGAEIADVIAWVAPNAKGFGSMVRRRVGGRVQAWRPILHWVKGARLPWEPGAFVEPNYYEESQVTTQMNEALPWPNQLPVKLVTWLLRPHRTGVVLDLFAGTGTTREAALGLGFDVVSVDLSPDAIALTRRRQAQLSIHAVDIS